MLRTITKDDRYSVVTSCGLDNHAGLYYQKVQSGGDSPNDHSKENSYYMTLTAFNNPEIDFNYYNEPIRHGTYGACGFGIGAALDFLLPTSNDQIEVVNRLGKTIRGHSFHAGVAIGESKRALDMIGDRTRTLTRFVRHLKHLRFNEAFRSVGMRPRRHPGKALPEKERIHQVYLEAEFGWRPLVNDLYEGANFVFRQLNKPVTRLFKSNLKKAEDVRDPTLGNIIIGKRETVIALRCYLEEDYPILDSLGLVDPASVAWELTPYSFIADWIYPFGNFLQARSVLQSLKAHKVYQTSFFKISLKTSQLGNPSLKISNYGPPITYLGLQVVRSPYVMSIPRPNFKKLSEFGSFRHALDGVALLLNFRK